MSTYDDYLTNEDKPYAENINDALLISNVFDLTIPIELPLMFRDGHFNTNTSARKAGVAIVTFIEKDNDVTINDNNINGTGNLTFKFYPNFNSYGSINNLDWIVTSGSITADIIAADNTMILSGHTGGVISGAGVDINKLQEFKIILHLNNATLTKLNIVMANKDETRYGAECGINDVTNLQTSLDNKANSTHTHGNISNNGKVGTTSGKPLITTTNGLITTGSFGSSAGSFCEGNDPRLSNSRTPTSHTHGNISNEGKVNSDTSSVNKILVTDGSNNIKTISVLPSGKVTHQNLSSKANTSHTHGNISNDGKIGTTSGKPLITTTNGLITIGNFGTSAGSFCQGNDARLSNSRTPTSHTHGNISNDGKIGTTSGKPVITGTNGAITTTSFGSSAGTVCEGNDTRLSNARTPTSHKHDKSDLNNFNQNVIDLVYPVGAIYISTSSTSPATLFGRGTWQEIQGRFLLARDNSHPAGSTGGEFNHTLTGQEIPSHNHAHNHYHTLASGTGQQVVTSSLTLGVGDVKRVAPRNDSNGTYYVQQTNKPAMGRISNTDGAIDATTNTGGGQAHNNTPPYLAVYMWKRTA